VRPPDKHRSES